MKKLACIILSILFLTSGCSKACRLTGITPLGEVSGKISPAVNASVNLYKDDVKVREENADSITGRFYINSLASGLYALSVANEGFDPVTQNISVQEGQITEIEITLAPVVPIEESPEFVPGEIIVGFKDEVTKEEAEQIINSYGLNLIANDAAWKMFSCWVEVLDGEEEDYIDELEASEIVLWAEVRGNSLGEPDKKYILIQFNVLATEESVYSLIDSFENLEIFSIIIPPKSGYIEVEPGTELTWIDILKEDQKLRYVELNYSVSICPK